jgi:hypothetical protein
MKKLDSPKEVMEAFLAGHKLQNTNYKADDNWLYLEPLGGYIAEEDGAGAKSDRVPICMRGGEEWWILE